MYFQTHPGSILRWLTESLGWQVIYSSHSEPQFPHLELTELTWLSPWITSCVYFGVKAVWGGAEGLCLTAWWWSASSWKFASVWAHLYTRMHRHSPSKFWRIACLDGSPLPGHTRDFLGSAPFWTWVIYFCFHTLDCPLRPIIWTFLTLPVCHGSQRDSPGTQYSHRSSNNRDALCP